MPTPHGFAAVGMRARASNPTFGVAGVARHRHTCREVLLPNLHEGLRRQSSPPRASIRVEENHHRIQCEAWRFSGWVWMMSMRRAGRIAQCSWLFASYDLTTRGTAPIRSIHIGMPCEAAGCNWEGRRMRMGICPILMVLFAFV